MKLSSQALSEFFYNVFDFTILRLLILCNLNLLPSHLLFMSEVRRTLLQTLPC